MFRMKILLIPHALRQINMPIHSISTTDTSIIISITILITFCEARRNCNISAEQLKAEYFYKLQTQRKDSFDCELPR
jgi:hypothetical protein